MNKLKEALESVKNTENISIDSSYIVKQYIVKRKDKIMGELSNNKSLEEFQKDALRALSYDKRLEDCNVNSFVACMVTCESLGVEANSYSGEAYIVPREVDGNKVAHVILGYKGALKMAYNAGVLKSIYANEVRENDEFDLDYGLCQRLTHKPYLRGDRGEIVGYYAVCNMNNGNSTFEYMSKKEVEEYGKKYSKNFSEGPWESEFESMAKKTLVKKVLKYMPFVKYVDNLSGSEESISRGLN